MPVQGFVLDPYLPETERFVLVFVFILFTLNKSYHLECSKGSKLDLSGCTDAMHTISDDMQRARDL